MSRGHVDVHTLTFRRNVAATVAAASGAGAAIAQTLNGPLWLRLTLSAIAVAGLCAALWMLVLEHRKQRGERNRVRTAVGLDVSRREGEVSLWVTNRGKHVVREVRVTAIPDDEDWTASTHGRLPEVSSDGSHREVSLIYPIVGGWFLAEVPQLNPGDGVGLLSYSAFESGYQHMDFDVRWNDHEGTQRKAQVSADLNRESGTLALKPRDTY